MTYKNNKQKSITMNKCVLTSRLDVLFSRDTVWNCKWCYLASSKPVVPLRETVMGTLKLFWRSCSRLQLHSKRLFRSVDTSRVINSPSTANNF